MEQLGKRLGEILNQNPPVGQNQQLGGEGRFFHAGSRFHCRVHSIKFKPQAWAIWLARALSSCETVRRSSSCRDECQAGQKPERKFTFTPGRFCASHSATGCQQHSTWPGVSRWRTINSP